MGINDKLLVAFPFGCNMDCIFCLRNKHPSRASVRLSGEQWPPLFHRLRALMRIMRRGKAKTLFLGGDEPTVAPAWLFDAVIALAVKEGFKKIDIMSNGFKLRDGKYLAGLVKAGVNSFSLPVYGPTAATHDSVTQKKGSYSALLRAIKNIQALPGVSLKLHTVRVKANQKMLGDIVAGMRKLGARCEIWELNDNRTDSQVNYQEIRADGFKPRLQQAVDSEAGKIGRYVRYNICTGEIY